MGAVQSKSKRDAKAQARYNSSILQHNSTTTSASLQQQQQQSFTMNASIKSNSSNSIKKIADLADNLKQASIYSTDSKSNFPVSYINNSTSPSTSSVSTPSPKKSTNRPKNHFDEMMSAGPLTNQSNSYYLPKDWDIVEYQYNLHFALKTLFGGNVTPTVAPVLKKGSRVIKMGACSGPWIMDMAIEYPDVSFTVIEMLKDRVETIPSLPNVIFISSKPSEEGLAFPDNSIDYIHIRGFGFSKTMNEWPMIYKEFRRILKPEGLIRIEEIHHAPTGTVMIESFVETLRQIMVDNNQDYDIALKYGDLFQENGFQVIESKKKTVRHGSDGKISEDILISILNGFENLGSVLAPKLGLDIEDYRHRIEMILAQCVRINACMEWYSWVGKKATSMRESASFSYNTTTVTA